MSQLRGALSWLLILLFGLTYTAQAAREVEPNDSAAQATLVDPSQEIQGTITDDFDFFKVILPQDGQVEIRVDGYPAGTRIRVGANGFSESDDELLEETTNQGRKNVRLKFTAQERVGFIWLEFLFADQVCQHGWCVAQLVEEGPWYLVKDGITPPEWQDKELLEPPEYHIVINQPGQASVPKKVEQELAKRPGYQHFINPEDGLGFDHPADWIAGPGEKSGTLLVQPSGDADHAMRIDLEVVSRTAMPGSSAEKQLNLAERDLGSIGAEIRQRGEMTVAGNTAPYLVAVTPAGQESGETARMQVIVSFSDHYVRVGYFGPSSDYPKAATIFENLLQSLVLEPPAAVKPAEK